MTSTRASRMKLARHMKLPTMTTMIRRCSYHAVVLLLAGGLLAASAGAQTAGPRDAGLPLMPYMDRTLGFAIQVPADWRYDRTGFFGPGGSAGLLRGASSDGRATLQILAFLDVTKPGFPSWIEYFGEQLGGIEGTRRVSVEGVEDADRPAAFVVVDAQIGIDHTRSYYYCIAFDTRTIFVLCCASVQQKSLGDSTAAPDADAEKIEIPNDFKRMTDSLRVLYDPKLAHEMANALQRGRDYLAEGRLDEAIRTLRINEAIRFYELFVEGKPVGYVTYRFTREAEPMQHPGLLSNAKDGLRVRERSYQFGENGAAQFDKVDLFSSRDGRTDLFEFSHAAIPPADAPNARPLMTRDQCVREGDTLFSTRITNEDVGLPEPRRPLKLDASYFGLAWSRLLPALLGPDAQPMIAFTVYDPETRTLLTYGIKPQGAETSEANGEPTFAYETRLGFAQHPLIIHTDRHGNTLRVTSDPIELRPSTSDTIERKYGTRRDAANQRMTQR